MMLEKENVLVRDGKGDFLKLFKNELIDQFSFSESDILSNNQFELKNFERFVSVAYNESELIDFLSLNGEGSSVLVCLFNEELYGNMTYLDEIKNIVLFGEYKTKDEFLRYLIRYLKKTPEVKKQFSDSGLAGSFIRQVHFDNYKVLTFFS